MIKGITEKENELDKENINDLVDRMSKIGDYQLKRTASSQFSIMHSAVEVETALKKLDVTLQKVYADKNLNSEWRIEPNSIFYGDESDLFEFLGNMMDNACKWSKS